MKKKDWRDFIGIKDRTRFGTYGCSRPVNNMFEFIGTIRDRIN